MPSSRLSTSPGAAQMAATMRPWLYCSSSISRSILCLFRLVAPGRPPGSSMASTSLKSAMSSILRSVMSLMPWVVSTICSPVMLTVFTSSPPRRSMSTGANASMSSKPLERNSYTFAIISTCFTTKSSIFVASFTCKCTKCLAFVSKNEEQRLKKDNIYGGKRVAVRSLRQGVPGG